MHGKVIQLYSCVCIYTHIRIYEADKVSFKMAASHATSKMLVIWALVFQLNIDCFMPSSLYHVGQLGIGIPFTHNIGEFSHIHPCGVEGSVIHSIRVRLVRRPCMSLAFLQPLSNEVNGYRG